MDDAADPAGQWPEVARNWKRLGPPLRPGREDVANYRKVLNDWCDENPGEAPRGLILGVTPELHDLPWPRRDWLHAIDREAQMIEHVWRGPKAQAMCCDWRDIPLPHGSIDIVMCDGGFHLLPNPHGQEALVRALADAVAPGGRVAFRLFVPPAEQESADDVLAALLAGHVRDLNCLKLRLWPALMTSSEAGVRLHDVWACLRSFAGDGGWPDLAGRLDWDVDHLLAIEGYKDVQARYYLVQTDGVIEMFEFASLGRFKLLETHTPTYDSGNLLCTVVFART